MPSQEEYRILGVDYGLKRIGLALTDPLLTFSYPYKTLANDNSFWKNLDKIIVDKSINKIILGYPLREDRTKSHVTDNVLKFKEELNRRYKLEVILRDESYTSLIAKERVIKSVLKKNKRKDKGLIDQNSAAIILQEYLKEKSG
jgi:putative Holliday junction resolvase